MNEGPILSPFDALPLSVGQFLDAVNIALRGRPASVFGEVTEFKESAKWVSFSLKDKEEEALLKCVISVWQYRKLGVMLEDGMEIKVSGNPSISKRWGSFGFWVETIEPLGEGSLKRAYELLQKQLQAEGLFGRKRPLPEFIKNVAVITSRDGVVIQDFRKNLARRGIKVTLIDTRVEGATAVPGLLAGIGFVMKHAHSFDALVIMRGGGGLESMQPFNNEAVCRALFSTPIPVIAAIGHDVNVPLAALVADREVSTPTAAAIAINQTWDRLTIGLPVLVQKIVRGFVEVMPSTRIERSTEKIIYRYEQVLRDAKHRGLVAGVRMSEAYQQIIAHLKSIEASFRYGVSRVKESISRMSERVLRLDRLIAFASPERQLSLGYSIVEDSKGRVLKSVSGLKEGESMKTRLAQGNIISIISKLEK